MANLINNVTEWWKNMKKCTKIVINSNRQSEHLASGVRAWSLRIVQYEIFFGKCYQICLLEESKVQEQISA